MTAGPTTRGYVGNNWPLVLLDEGYRSPVTKSTPRFAKGDRLARRLARNILQSESWQGFAGSGEPFLTRGLRPKGSRGLIGLQVCGCCFWLWRQLVWHSRLLLSTRPCGR